jgi:hypothetical protein
MSAWQVEAAPARVEKKVFAALPATGTKEPARRWFGLRLWAWQLACGFAVLLLIVAIGMPNLLRSRMAANEASSVGALRTLHTACVTYASTYGGFPESLEQLGPGSPPSRDAADLIDGVLASGRKAGYAFTYTPGPTDASGNIVGYAITAQPLVPEKTGVRCFFTDESGVIRARFDGPADSNSPPIETYTGPSGQEASVATKGRATADGSTLPSGPMIIRTAALTIVTKEFENTRAAMEQVVRKHGGYIAQLSAAGQAGGAKALSVTLRIPTDKLDSALVELKQLGRVQNETIAGEEATQQYGDLVARRDNARHTEQRLVEVLRQRAGKVNEVLEAEREVARVRSEIERMDAQRKNLEKQVQFATVSLRITEEYKAQVGVPEASVGTQVWNAAVDGYRTLTETVLGLALFLLRQGPVLLFWLALLWWPARLVWRRMRAAA